MIGKLKKNTKIKIIALLSAIVLWMYVMAVVDPEDTKLYEDIPITITNLNEIKNLDLVVDPDEDLVTSVYVKGNLSDLQNISSKNINVYGVVDNPIEGQNQLKLSVSGNSTAKVNIDLKSNNIVINLEKNIEEEKEITVKVTGKYKDNIENIELKNEKIIVSGPRSRVNSVKYVQAELNADEELTKTCTKSLNLKPLDSDMKQVNDVNLQFKKVDATISFLHQKEVKVKAVFKGNLANLVEGENFTISPSTIQIRGKKEDLDNIEFISTESIDIGNFTSNVNTVKLNVPQGIVVKDDNVKIKMLKDSDLIDIFTYSGSSLGILNNNSTVSLNDFEIPDSIKVTLKYNNQSQKISKNELKLYIDLQEGFASNKQYVIKHNNLDVKSIVIEPSYIKSK